MPVIRRGPGGRAAAWLILIPALTAVLACHDGTPDRPPPQVIGPEELAGAAAGGEPTVLELNGVRLRALPAGDVLRYRVPPGVGPRARFETYVGLRPAAQTRGAAVRFRIAVRRGEQPAAKRDAVYAGASDPAEQRWQRLPPVIVRSGDLLELSAGGTPGKPPAPGAALWGLPRIITDRRAPGPNLLVVAVDTLRADVLGCYGDHGGPGATLTPRIDRLAAGAVRFSDLASPAPWTLPSFASLETGLSPFAHGAGQARPDDRVTRLAPAFHTLAEELSERGLATVGIYDNAFLSPDYGLAQGFDEYHRYHWHHHAGVLVDRAIDWLAEHRETRFFLFLQLLDPHTPYDPPAATCDRVARALVPDGPPGRCRVVRHVGSPAVPAELRPWARALYRAEVAYTDGEVGRLLDALAATGLAEDTVVLFVSDHGEDLWRRLDQEQRLGYETVSDHGHTLYRELLRVPAILSGPGLGPRVVSEPAGIEDLYPTLLALLGFPVSSPGQGRDLTPLLSGGGVSRPAAGLAGALRTGPPRYSLRRGRWKLIAPLGWPGPVELYDLTSDPGETHDRAADERRRVAALRRAGEAAIRERLAIGREIAGDARDELAEPDREDRRTLRALGYLR